MKKPVLVILLILVFVCGLSGQTDSSSRYYVSVKGERYGPFAISDMERMKNNDQISAGTLVWKQGWKQDADSWKAAETVPELAFLFLPGYTQDDPEIRDRTKEIRLNPNSANVYHNRGLTYGYKGAYDRAIQDWEKAIAINPNFQWAKDRLKGFR
jgi:tetratricopeptide (TPR) repeat protein